MKETEIKPEILTKENILLKNWNKNTLYHYEGKILKTYPHFTNNLEYTLESIEEERIHLEKFKNLLIPESFATKNHQKIGILLPQGYPDNIGTFLDKKYSFETRISVLKNLGKLLHDLQTLRKEEHILTDFFIGDLHEKNVLFDMLTKEIQICDLDSCKIHNNQNSPIKHRSPIYLTEKYYDENGKTIISQESDLYCYIVIIFRVLFSIDITYFTLNGYKKFFSLLKIEGMPTPFIKAFQRTYTKYPNTNPYNSLEYLEEKLVKKIHL